jgi:universal stress protein A
MAVSEKLFAKSVERSSSLRSFFKWKENRKMKALTSVKRIPPPLLRTPRRTLGDTSRIHSHRAKTTSILVPVDFSEASTKALDYALALARQTNARVTLLHVLETVAMPEFAAYPVAPDSERAVEVRRRLAKLARDHGNGSDKIEVKVLSGIPFREITRAADSLKMNLIVIATRGYTGLAHVLMGSTAERVVRYAGCPVLIVPTRK